MSAGAFGANADFNINTREGASNRIIEDYQDRVNNGAGGAVSRPRLGRNKRAPMRSSVVMMAADGDIPEGSWGDVKRMPCVGGNWKSNGDRDFVNTFPKDVLN